MFKKVEISDISVVSKFLGGFEPYSDFNPVSLLCWNSGDCNEYKIENNLMTIKITDYLRNKPVYSVIGNQVEESYLVGLLSEEIPIKMLPEVVAQSINCSKVSFNEDRDNFDYILDLQQFAELKGGTYKPLRKKVGIFERLYKDVVTKPIDLGTKPIVEKILKLTTEWCENRNFDKEELDENIRSIAKYVEIKENIDCMDIGLFISDKLIGFSLNQLLKSGWVMGHFGFTDTSFEHSALYLEHKTAQVLYSNGSKLLNIEQDTGLEGLRESKMSYRPLKFLKKYQAVLKPTL